MPENIEALLSEMEAFGQKHDAAEADHSRRMLNLEPDTARLIRILIGSGSYTRLLEVGTSNGYSTLWLADAVRRTGGHLVSVERRPEKTAMAVQNLARAGLSDRVTLLTGDARQVLDGLPGPFDLVFLDADRPSYPAYLDLLLPRLAPKVLLLADNVHSHPAEIAAYLGAIGRRAEFEHTVVGVGKGLSLAFRAG